ncbi:GtrA family protein [Paraburkholderia denitrificans]|uniref:GtrA family protein n=1 Tax=Paraburkholderia denitrificans TaxID=694025 RepID=A0ABW0J8C6_9BURK
MLRFAGYACVGAMGTIAQYLVLAALVSTHVLGAVAASCIGAVVGAIVNYYLNYRFTFRSTSPHRKTAPRFFTVAAASIGLNGALMFALTHWAHLSWLLAQCVTTACVMVLTYTASSVWTFRAQQA